MKLQRQVALGAARAIARSDMNDGCSRWMDTMFRIKEEIGLEGYLHHQKVGAFRAGKPWEDGEWDVEGLATHIQEVFTKKFEHMAEPPVVNENLLPDTINGVPATKDGEVLMDYEDAEIIRQLEDVYIYGDFTIEDYTSDPDCNEEPIGPTVTPMRRAKKRPISLRAIMGMVEHDMIPD